MRICDDCGEPLQPDHDDIAEATWWFCPECDDWMEVTRDRD